MLNRRTSKAHWVSDARATHCAHDGCGKAFNWTLRKHHCRMCGLVFCEAHSSRRLRLDADHRPSSAGELARVCDGCFNREERGPTPPLASSASVALKLHVAGEVASRDRTALFLQRRANSNRDTKSATAPLVEAYAALCADYTKPAGPQSLIGGKKVSWKGPSDSGAARCGVCYRGFTQFFRRHHCRLCSTVVCDDCSAHRKVAASEGGFVYRSCDKCHELLERHSALSGPRAPSPAISAARASLRLSHGRLCARSQSVRATSHGCAPRRRSRHLRRPLAR